MWSIQQIRLSDACSMSIGGETWITSFCFFCAANVCNHKNLMRETTIECEGKYTFSSVRFDKIAIQYPAILNHQMRKGKEVFFNSFTI